MNILHVSSAFTWRGGEQQIAYLINELKELGHNNFLMHPKNAPIADHSLIKDSCICIPYNKGFSVNPLVAYRIKNESKKYKIDIIHAHDSHAHTFLYLSYILFKLQFPSVVSRRVDFNISPSSYKKYAHFEIKKILCVSNKINEIVSASLGSSERVETVYSGVDLEKFKESSPNNLRQSYSIPLEHKIIANVSAIAGHKDYETFVNTARELLKMRSDVTFLIVGADGGEKNRIVEMINEYNLNANIKLTGYVEDAYKLISQLDIFLFPSKMEGLGTSILDAQASCTPVVSTFAGGIPELVEHKSTGLLSPIGDAQDLASNINMILEDRELKDKLINNAKVNVRKFSKKHTAQKTLNIYNDVI